MDHKTNPGVIQTDGPVWVVVLRRPVGSDEDFTRLLNELAVSGVRLVSV